MKVEAFAARRCVRAAIADAGTPREGRAAESVGACGGNRQGCQKQCRAALSGEQRHGCFLLAGLICAHSRRERRAMRPETRSRSSSNAIEGMEARTSHHRGIALLFVPLPFLSIFLLLLALGWIIATRDMKAPAHRIFASLGFLYCLQSILIIVRWAYGMDAVTPAIALIAPLLPALAFVAFDALAGGTRRGRLFAAATVLANWVVLLVFSELADLTILLTYLGFGGLMLLTPTGGGDALVQMRLEDARVGSFTLRLAGALLVGSGLTDLYVLGDFFWNEGRFTLVVISIVQTLVPLLLAVVLLGGRVAAVREPGHDGAPRGEADEDAAAVMARLERLFREEKIYLSDELSLRRISRRLGLSDRAVSRAINMTTSMNVSQFVNSYRIDEACRLLRDPNKTVLEVSLQAGFATKSNFNREFSRITGQSPSQWRATGETPLPLSRAEPDIVEHQ